MAHYDCTNCGAYMGIGFGSCNSCTPKEYFDLKDEVVRKYDLLKDEWEKAHEKEKDEYINKGLEELRAKLKNFKK